MNDCLGHFGHVYKLNHAFIIGNRENAGNQSLTKLILDPLTPGYLVLYITSLASPWVSAVLS